jgi:hypothetical protein
MAHRASAPRASPPSTNLANRLVQDWGSGGAAGRGGRKTVMVNDRWYKTHWRVAVNVAGGYLCD